MTSVERFFKKQKQLPLPHLHSMLIKTYYSHLVTMIKKPKPAQYSCTQTHKGMGKDKTED